jgi:hypothetical protein
MRADIRCVLLAICAVLMTVLSAHAENRSFADLLIQAKAQAAAGHRWTPPGDNMTETIMRMIDLIPTATPAQLSELSALIESGRANPVPTALRSDLMTEDRPAQAVPAPPASQPLASPVTAELAPPPVLPARPGPERAGQFALGQVPPSPITPSPITPNPITHGPIVPGQTIPDAGSRAAVLFARGLDAELHGDLSGARRFYFSAAQQGDAAAARDLGRLYDPTYLKQIALGGVDPDPALARHWYERAVRLGDAEAGPLLEALSVR